MMKDENNAVEKVQKRMPDDTGFPAFLKFLSWLSMLSGAVLILLILMMVIDLLRSGALDRQDNSFYIEHTLPQMYLRFLLSAVCGIAIFAGGKWSLDRKPLGWHVMSCCFLFASLYSGRLINNTLNHAIPLVDQGILVIAVPLCLIFTAGYVYLFTDSPRNILNVTLTKRWQMFALHIALYLFLYFLFSLLKSQ